ncbi:hypothetical protein YH65_03005 [Sulfurovum lithotrophicum]|uniref:Uncharacterized protein n=1 Tax=Sulfurovum lithotrophicum TaxID=206403 RepID=A0A7U4M089_9BACT|nr:hypothetical protein [Sulfurovum lithotrophicum]AKF24475.1 hypothetical protein YH65_03005 [Sulfurovum lithotrophicum]
MCLIITLIMLVLSIQNLMEGYYNIGILQLVIALGFAFMLWRNIQITRCERSGNCSGCTLPEWLTKWFKKEEK